MASAKDEKKKVLKYVAEHKFEDHLNEVVNKTVKTRPEDPFKVGYSEIH